MTTLVLPLGIIVKTNDMASIIAFQKLADNLGLGIKITPIIQELYPLFVKFNLGSFTEPQFEEALLEAIESKIPEENKAKLADNWKDAWRKGWKDAWNAMCQFDARATEVAEFISTLSKLGVNIEILTDSNPTQAAFNIQHLAKFGIDGSRIRTTFSSGKSIEVILKEILEDRNADIESQRAAIILGNPENVKNEFLRKKASEKQQKILNLVEKTLQVSILQEEYLTVEKLQEVLNKINPSILSDTMNSTLAIPTVGTLTLNSMNTYLGFAPLPTPPFVMGGTLTGDKPRPTVLTFSSQASGITNQIGTTSSSTTTLGNINQPSTHEAKANKR